MTVNLEPFKIGFDPREFLLVDVGRTLDNQELRQAPYQWLLLSNPARALWRFHDIIKDSKSEFQASAITKEPEQS